MQIVLVLEAAPFEDPEPKKHSDEPVTEQPFINLPYFNFQDPIPLSVF